MLSSPPQSVCRKCKKVGHYASVCETKHSSDSATEHKSSGTKKEFRETKYVEVVEEDTDDDDVVLGIFKAKDSGNDGHTPVYVSVMLDQKSCKMLLDNGATVAILPKVWYEHSSSDSGPYVVPR